MSGVVQDLRYAARWLVRNPGFTALAVLTLGLGIGANTALFGVCETVLLRSLPVREPARLVLFEWRAGEPFRTSGRRGPSTKTPPGTTGASIFRYDVFDRMRQARAAAPNGPLADFFAFAPLYEITAVAHDRAQVVRGQAVTGTYFEGVGVRPILGREIVESDDRPGAAPVVVISHRFWQEQFGGDPAVVGRPLTLNRLAFTVVGVNPSAFVGTLQVDYRAEVTVPLAFESALLGDASALTPKDGRSRWFLNVMGRLAPGATEEQALESLAGVFQVAALDVMPPPTRDNEPARLAPKDYPRLIVRAGGQGLMERRQRYSTGIAALFAVVGVVLLIACANLANLMLARSALRSAEIRTRLALGASRGRLVRQLLTESFLIAALAGVAGVIFSLWGTSAMAALSEGEVGILPSGISGGLTWSVLGFTVGLTGLTALLFGSAPAWRASDIDLVTALKQNRRTVTRTRLGGGLVVVQVALSVLLLAGAGLLLRTLHNLSRVPLGFNQEQLLVFTLRPGQVGYTGARLLQFDDRLLARLDALPGVREATFSRIPPIAEYSWNVNVLLPGENAQTAPFHNVNRQAIRENYFQALEIPKLRGRAFDARDGEKAPGVAVVNQEFVRRYFPNADPVGQRIQDADEKREVEIVGVVADTKYENQRSEIAPLLYTPWRQESESDMVDEMYFALRSAQDPASLAAGVQAAVRDLDPNLPVTEIGTQTARSRSTLARERVYAEILTFFGALALALAAIGLFGILAYSVAQRTNEIGIRMALGARGDDVVRMIVAQGMRPAALGLILGLGASLALGRTVASMVYGIRADDPVTLLSVSALLLAIAALAAFLPARRAARVDPIVALRTE
ncbi:MAG TPA: ABC transporter permease [Thermoanaerobaculia bacterium]|jgi:predicted permease